jgi:hypothetical protein
MRISDSRPAARHLIALSRPSCGIESRAERKAPIMNI